MTEKYIYTIVCVSGDPDIEGHRGHPDRMRSRCWGYYFNRADAENCIENNGGDIFEDGYYQYAVLSAVGEGPLADQEELQWYEISINREAPPHLEVLKIEKPEKYRQYMFGLG